MNPTTQIEPRIVDRNSIPDWTADWFTEEYDSSVEQSESTGFGRNFAEFAKNSAQVMTNSSTDVDFDVNDVPVNVHRQPARLVSAKRRRGEKPDIAQIDRQTDEPTRFLGDDKKVGDDGIEQALKRRARPGRRRR